MNRNSVLKSEESGTGCWGQENTLLTRCLLVNLNYEEHQALAGFMTVYQNSRRVAQAARYVFFSSLAALAMSFWSWAGWLADYRGHLGLTAISAFLCLYLIVPVLENAISGLQGLTDRAMARGGLPPFEVRA